MRKTQSECGSSSVCIGAKTLSGHVRTVAHAARAACAAAVPANANAGRDLLQCIRSRQRQTKLSCTGSRPSGMWYVLQAFKGDPAASGDLPHGRFSTGAVHDDTLRPAFDQMIENRGHLWRPEAMRTYPGFVLFMGTLFMSLKEMYEILGVKSVRTSVYHPQTIRLVERMNQKSMICKFIHKDEHNWDCL